MENHFEIIDKKVLAMTDEELNQNFVSIMQEYMENGSCASLINNDNGQWAIADEGQQNLPSGNEPLVTTFYVEAKCFSDTIAGALRLFAQDK